VHAPTVCGLPEAPFDLVDRGIERGVEVSCAGLGTNDRPTDAARYLYSLTVVGLTGIFFVEKFDIGSGDACIVALDAGELLGNMLSKMLGNLDVTSADY
jgi:hypothetical protein